MEGERNRDWEPVSRESLAGQTGHLVKVGQQHWLGGSCVGRTFMTDTATLSRVTHTLASLGYTDAVDDDADICKGEDDDEVSVRFRVT